MVKIRFKKEDGICKCKKNFNIIHEEMIKTRLKRDEEYVIFNIKNREEKEEVLYNMGYKDLLVQVYKFIDNEDRREIKYKITNNTYML